MRSVRVALCVFDSSRVELSWTLSLYSSERCLHFTYRRAWQATTQKLEASLSLSLSLLFSLRFTHIHPWLLLTYFSPSPSRRGTSRYIHGVLHASEEHAWSRTVSHALTRTNAHVIDQGASRVSRSEEERDLAFSLFETNFHQCDETL